MARPEPPRLPVALAGQGDFHGSWTGSLVDPRLAGNLKATNWPSRCRRPRPVQDAKLSQPQFVHLDSVDAMRQLLGFAHRRSNTACCFAETRRSLSAASHGGCGEASAGRSRDPGGWFWPRVVLRHSTPTPCCICACEAAKVGVDDLQPFLAQNLPLAGALDAQLQADGPIHALGGSGWVRTRWRQRLRRAGYAHPGPGNNCQRRAQAGLDHRQPKPAGNALGHRQLRPQFPPLPAGRQGRGHRRRQNRAGCAGRGGLPPAGWDSPSTAQAPSTTRNLKPTPRSAAWPWAGNRSAAWSLWPTPPTTPSPTT